MSISYLHQTDIRRPATLLTIDLSDVFTQIIRRNQTIKLQHTPEQYVTMKDSKEKT